MSHKSRECTKQWLVVALGTSGNLVADAIEEYSRGHRTIPVAAYYRIGSSRMPADLPARGGPPHVYKKYIAVAGLGKHLDSGAKAYDLQRDAVRKHLMSIKDAHPGIENVLLLSSAEGGTAGVYLAKLTREGKEDHRILDDIVDCMAVREIWAVVLGPSTTCPDRVVRDNTRQSLRALEGFATRGRERSPPIAANATFATRALVSHITPKQPRLVGLAVATILDMPSKLAAVDKEHTMEPGYVSCEDEMQLPHEMHFSHQSSPWSFLCFNGVSAHGLMTGAGLFPVLQEIAETSASAPWIEPRVCSLAEHPKGFPLYALVFLTALSEHRVLLERTTLNAMSTGIACALMRLAKLSRDDIHAETIGVWDDEGPFRNQSALTILIRGVKIDIDSFGR